jgi:hypothetical protein
MTWRRENSWPYRELNSDTSVVQPVASRYTDCAITAPVLFGRTSLNSSAQMVFGHKTEKKRKSVHELRGFLESWMIQINKHTNATACAS